MRAISFALLIALVGFAAGCGKKPDGDKDSPTPGGGDDKSALQGSWSVVKLDMGDDKDEFSKKIAEDMTKVTFTVNGDIVSVNDPKEKAKGPVYMKITLDPAKTLKAIDFLPTDEKGTPKPGKDEKFNPATKKVESKEVPAEPVLCIYKFEGDTLVVAVPVSFGDKSPRPKEFKASVPKGKDDGKEPLIVLFHLKKK